MMRTFVVILLLFFSSPSFAVVGKKLSCEKRIAKSSIPKKQRKEFCACWNKKLKVLSKAEVEKLKPWIDGKITNIQLEQIDYPLAEFIYNVEDSCL